MQLGHCGIIGRNFQSHARRSHLFLYANNVRRAVLSLYVATRRDVSRTRLQLNRVIISVAISNPTLPSDKPRVTASLHSSARRFAHVALSRRYRCRASGNFLGRDINLIIKIHSMTERPSLIALSRQLSWRPRPLEGKRVERNRFFNKSRRIGRRRWRRRSRETVAPISIPPFTGADVPDQYPSLPSSPRRP